MTQLDVRNLAAILAAAGHDLDDAQVMAIKEFLDQVGSMDKAQQTIEALCASKRAA